MDGRGLPARVIIGIVFGVIGGVLFVTGVILFCIRLRSKKAIAPPKNKEGSQNYALPMRKHGDRASAVLSDAVVSHQSSSTSALSDALDLFSAWWRSFEEPPRSSNSGITKFTYRELQKATKNFTTLLGQGAFGPVYKALLPNGATIAVKVLAVNSKQGEKEFQNEVMLLGRLHHKNLLNLVGYCVERGHRVLAYEYMCNGSLSARLHDEHYKPLSWEQRVSIAQDVSRGIEYLHDGAVPPVIHRDIKSSNILLDSFMTARVADFGLSKEADPDMPASGVRGTYGYVDPEYVSTNSLTDKSDVYSFGVLLFELIAARSPRQGLMDYVDMEMMVNEGKAYWLEILDPRLNGQCNFKELEEMSLIASKCVEKKPNKRPRIREVAQALLLLDQKTNSARIDFQGLASGFERRVELIEGAERGMVSRSPSRVEVRG